MNATTKTALKFAAVGALGLGLMAAALTPMIEAQDHKIAAEKATVSELKSNIDTITTARDSAQKSYRTCLSASGAYGQSVASYELTLANVSTEFLNLFDTATFDVALASMKSNLADARLYASVGDGSGCR